MVNKNKLILNLGLGLTTFIFIVMALNSLNGNDLRSFIHNFIGFLVFGFLSYYILIKK